jgi:hypothetical protein
MAKPFIEDVVSNLNEIPGVDFSVKKKDDDVEIYYVNDDGSGNRRMRYLVCKHDNKSYHVHECGFVVNRHGDCYNRECDPMVIKKDKLFEFIKEQFLSYAEK